MPLTADSSLYLYFLQDLQTRIDRSQSNLPANLFDLPIGGVLPDSLSSALFLMEIAAGQNNSFVNSLFTIDHSDKPLTTAFKNLHRALGEVLHGADAATHLFRINAKNIAHLIQCSTNQKREWLFARNQTICYAMACCLLEACIYTGWCHSSSEGKLKRAAHGYFMFCKKNIYQLDNRKDASAFDTIYCYLYAAYWFAQKSEGIAEQMCDGEITSTGSSRVDLIDDTQQSTSAYYAFNSTQLANFQVVAVSKTALPTCFRALFYESLCGMFLKSNQNYPISFKLTNNSLINRKMHKGINLDYEVSFVGNTVDWRVVYIFYENTTYRIDTIKNTSLSSVNDICLDFGVEITGVNLQRVDNTNNYRCYGNENTVISFIINQPAIHPVLQLHHIDSHAGIAHFVASEIAILPGATIQTIAAFSYGKGITAINQTNLIGIFD